MNGYARISDEIEAELSQGAHPAPSHVFVQAGVGGLAAAMAGPARLAIMPGARGRDQGGVDQRARANHNPALIKLTCDGLEQGPVQTAAHQLGAEAHKGGALGRGLMSGKATEPAKAGPVIESFRVEMVKGPAQ